MVLFFYILFFYFIYIYFWLCWVFISVRGFSLVAASRGHSSSRCGGLSLSRPLLLRSTGSRRAGSVVVAHGPSCSAACGILPDQSSNPCPLHWQADSQPLRHQGSPLMVLLIACKVKESWNFVLSPAVSPEPKMEPATRKVLSSIYEGVNGKRTGFSQIGLVASPFSLSRIFIFHPPSFHPYQP